MPTTDASIAARTTKPDAGVAPPRRRPVSWSDVNLLLDAALLLNFVGVCIAAVIVRFVFPSGLAARGWELWGLDYDGWARIQFGLLAVLAVGILVHVMLHWSWVCNVLAARLSRNGRGRIDEGTQTIYGVGLLIVLLTVIGITAASAWLTIRPPGG